MPKNIHVTPQELTFIRNLDDFDLTMLLSEIHDYGWVSPKYGAKIGGKALLPMIMEAVKTRKAN